LRAEIDSLKSKLPYGDKVEVDGRVDKLVKKLHKQKSVILYLKQ